MKLKEKLARDYEYNEYKKYIKEHGIEDDYGSFDIVRAYIAGFEKAKEIAAEKVERSVAPGIFDFINQRLQAIHDQTICLALGDEEIDE